MSRGGWYRSPDGKGSMHLLFGRKGMAPTPCMAPCKDGDDPALFAGRCARMGTKLCDAVVDHEGVTPTCDRSMCPDHTTHVDPDTDYCPLHAHLGSR